MNPFAAIEALSGPPLVAIIAALLFLEEVGVPLPFTPGDLLLAIGGIAIAAGGVNPVLFVGATLIAVLVGAMVGRELCSHISWGRLMKIAGWLHATAALTRTGDMIDRGGWRAIFVARLIPGLRVYSTQIAGVRGMPRRRFFAGLLPASVVYVAGFTGLGVAFGHPVLAIIHRVEHEGTVILIGLIILVALIVAIHFGGRRALRSAGGWSGLLTVRPTSSALLVIPLAIGLDVAGHAIAVYCHLPLFLDSVGTVLAAVVGGPWVGGSVGFISDLLLGDTIDPSSATYAVVAFAIGFAVGLTRSVDRDARARRWVLVWVVAFGASSTLSTALNLLLAGGHTGFVPSDALYAFLAHARVLGTSLPPILVAYLAQASLDLPDKLLTVLGAMGILALVPAQPLAPPRDSPGVNLASAFAGVFHSERWLPRLGVVALCVLFWWVLLIPFLLFAGYLVAVARSARRGAQELPPWDQLGRKLRDGAGLTLVFLLWALPAVITKGAAWGISDLPPLLSRTLTIVGSGWIGLLVFIQPAIWAEIVDTGFRAAVTPSRVLRRLGRHLGMAAVIGTISWALIGAALLGFVAVVVGAAITIPYFSVVAARLFAEYAAMTSDSGAVPSGRGPRESPAPLQGSPTVDPA